MKRLIPQSIRNMYHLMQAILANVVYGFPSKNIAVIGVTGTNGKTTTCQMTTKILEEAGFRVAMNSTINFKIKEKEWVNATKFTTLSSFKIQKFIREATKAGCTHLVLEVSSHALDQNRLWGIDFAIAVITNVTREHLDYHRTMEHYRKTKCKLFENAKIAIVNLDMEKPEEYLGHNAIKKYGYTAQIQSSKLKVQIGNPNLKVVQAEDIELSSHYSKFRIHDSKFTLNMPGKFNVENALAAIGVGMAENIPLETMSRALQKIKTIPGRFEFVENNKDFNIIVDYAVTPDSLEKLYALVAQINNDQHAVIAVFGSCGDRDRGKRPIMGSIVSRCANYVIVTNEDPYTEDPQRIIDEVASGVKDKTEGENFWKIFDRREAIKKALRIATPGDYVVVTGKGAEETMAVGNKRIPWNDRKVILEELLKI